MDIMSVNRTDVVETEFLKDTAVDNGIFHTVLEGFQTGINGLAESVGTQDRFMPSFKSV